jgi:hypothetical protein
MQIYSSERRFSVWAYCKGHSQLWLRSVMDENYDTAIDIWFKPVDEIHVPIMMHGLTIRGSGPKFELNGQDWAGSINAALCHVYEGKFDFDEPSKLGDFYLPW